MPTVQKFACLVERIIDHGSHVYTLFLQPERRPPRFFGGQFLHLALDTYDPSQFWPDSRPFSIANSPLSLDQIQISYSVNGLFTSRMEVELIPGSIVWVKMPYGEFIVDPNREAVLFAGGTGITAFSAFLTGLDMEHPHQVYLIYGARTSQLLIYQNLIEVTRQKVERLRVEYYAEENALAVPGVKSGRLFVSPGIRDTLKMEHPVFYLAGPPVMLTHFSADLRAQGIASEDIRIDAWN